MVEWSISLQPQEELAAFARFGNAVASLCVEKKGARACLKKAFRELRVPVRGRFYPNKPTTAQFQDNRMVIFEKLPVPISFHVKRHIIYRGIRILENMRITRHIGKLL